MSVAKALQAWRWVQQSLFAADEKPPVEAGAEAIARPLAGPPAETPVEPHLATRTAWDQALAQQPGARPLRLQFSNRALHNWSLTWRGSEGLTLRLPPSLREPPPDIARALVAWAHVVVRRPRKPDDRLALRSERKRLETLIRAHLDALVADDAHVASRHKRRSQRLIERLIPQGRHHDLRQIFAAVNAEYFEGRLQAQITWSHRLGGLSTHCEKNHPEGGRFHLITISRGYDSPDVTPEILGGVVYHECLHIVYPPEVRNGRRVVHGRTFHQAERRYRHYDIWMHWHRHGLPKALRRKQAGRD